MNLEHPLFVNLQRARAAFSDYPGNATDRAVFVVIAQYANRRGVAWPTLRTVAAVIGKTAVEVCRSVHRLAEKGFLKISQALKKNDRHPRNVYKIARRFLRRQPDAMSSHYIAAKWKAKAADVAANIQKHVTNAADALKSRAEQIAARWDKWDAEKTGGTIAAPSFRLSDSRINSDLADLTPGAQWVARRAILKAPHETEADYLQALQAAREQYADYEWN